MPSVVEYNNGCSTGRESTPDNRLHSIGNWLIDELTGRVATLLLSHDMYLLVAKDKSSPPLLQAATALHQSSGIVLSSF